MSRLFFFAVPLLAMAATAGHSDYDSAKRKFDLIEGGRLRAGSKVQLSGSELNAYVAHEVPPGVRNPHVEVVTPEVATATALIDFDKVRRAQGSHPGWLMSKLLGGERPVSVTARIRSGEGKATVDVQRVEISGLEIDGKTLDFLIQNFLIPMYPTATVGRPFQLGNRIDKLDVQPAGVNVWIGR